MAQEWVEEALQKVDEKLAVMVKRNQGKIPYMAIDGVYDDESKDQIYWWTNGFYAGELWQMYHYNQNESYKKEAISIEEKLDRALEEYRELHHDVGFMWLHTAVAHYRLTGDEHAKTRGLHAANLLAGRFNLAGRFLVSWNIRPGWAIIDSMMNLPILYWASAETKESRYAQLAKAHADTVLKNMVRSDYSIAHIGSFDPDTGEFLNWEGGQGYSPTSSWTRGQAWGLYGYALSYLHTKDLRYLEVAKNVAHYFLANVSQTNYLTPVDFRSPKEGPLHYDASAGLCAACGLLEIAKHVPEDEKDLYLNGAEKLVTATLEHFTDFDVTTDGIVTKTTHSYHNPKEKEVPIIYGDYFLIEALLRLINKDFLIW